MFVFLIVVFTYVEDFCIVEDVRRYWDNFIQAVNDFSTCFFYNDDAFGGPLTA